MPNHDNAPPLEDPFYTHEGGDDFTFFIPRDGKSSQTGKNAKSLKERLKFEADKQTGQTKEFSFSERISVKTLTLSKDSLKKLAHFKSSSQDRHKYLRGKMRALKRKRSGDSDSTLLLAVLNQSIQGSDLRSKPWVKKLSDEQTKFIESISDGKIRKKWRNRLLLERTFPELLKPGLIGRGLFCLAHAAEYISVSFRTLRDEGGYSAQRYPANKEEQRRKRRAYLFSIGEYCDLLYREVIKNTGSQQHAHGLLVITGSTKSAKSEIARGLIDQHLRRSQSPNRVPHLVTFEDPIEAPYLKLQGDKHLWNLAVEKPAVKPPVDFTPRQKEHDADFLRRALEDALRQTPAVFFVGETRRKREWELLLDFASTGHLIVTTAHAGSLVEAMHKIFEARQVKTASDRSEVANKLLAMVHVGNESVAIAREESAGAKQRAAAKKNASAPETAPCTNVLFPALWRRTSRGVAALTCDGLSSLLPHRGTQQPGEDAPSCIGRRWFIEELIKLVRAKKRHSEFPFELELIKECVFQRALQWDLQGV